MAVSVTWVEYNGTQNDIKPSTKKGQSGQKGISGSYPIHSLNFGNIDSKDIVPTLYPVAAGSASYAKFFKLQFSGSFTSISNIMFWKSSGLLGVGEDIKFSGSVRKGAAAPSTTLLQTTYPGAGSFIPVTVPSSVPTTANVCAPTLTSQVLPQSFELHSSPGYYSGVRTSTIALQMQTQGTIGAGYVNTKVFSVTYTRV